MADRIWFPEPEEVDNTWSSRDESVSQYLERSTHPRAIQVRSFLNRNISCLPDYARSSICHDLNKKDFDSALFELVVARTLQLLGGSLDFEQQNAEGRHPDFTAQFRELTIVVEATAPKFDQNMALQKKEDNLLLGIIESRVPKGWSVLLESLPDFDSAESKTSLKRALDKISNKPPPQNAEDQLRFRFDLPQGPLKFTLIPGKYGSRAIGCSPVYVDSSDAKQRIRHALKNKRSQVRSEGDPVLLAILGSGSADFDDFDEVLFGHFANEFDSEQQTRATHFSASGMFAKGSGLPTYSGILAFTDLTPLGCQGPVLYVHPRSVDPFPAEFEILERRNLTIDGIEILPRTEPHLLEDLGWARL